MDWSEIVGMKILSVDKTAKNTVGLTLVDPRDIKATEVKIVIDTEPIGFGLYCPTLNHASKYE